MTPHFRTIGLYGKYNDASVRGPLDAMAAHLRHRGITVLLGETTASQIEGTRTIDAAHPSSGDKIELAVVIGGDGTMLNAARALAASNVPLIGVNLGRLGFLTDIASNSMTSAIDAVLDGEYTSEQRTMLTVSIVQDDAVRHQAVALNDVVVSKGESARLLEFNVYVDNAFVSRYRADGLIIATPTGSTAYALSSGGPIIYPSLPLVELVPICPHTLSNRPIVLDASRRIRIGPVANQSGVAAHVSVDGHLHYTFQGDEVVEVTQAEQKVTLIRPHDHDHFATLRGKLGWGGQLNRDG